MDPRWKEPRFPGSPVEGTSVPRYEVLRVWSPGPPLPPGEMENFRKGECSIFPNMEEFNLLQPTKARLRKTI
ncbi:hypothetical protein F2Q69_00013586 [Brassica cretica]|uniref:Uncharacterized protein n=1 Tax=Brassica cretica TaxID=69181 RepID=A0A8S9R9M3_BRACR|nr:hypothetical protein F2Q69_00013586 [Brassica cretica]